jgi:hypothetical protein
MNCIHFINHSSMVMGTESMRESKEPAAYLCRNRRGSSYPRGRTGGVRVRTGAGRAALPAKLVPHDTVVPKSSVDHGMFIGTHSPSPSPWPAAPPSCSSLQQNTIGSGGWNEYIWEHNKEVSWPRWMDSTH